MQRILNKFIEFFCRMSGLAVMLSVATSTASKDIDKFIFLSKEKLPFFEPHTYPSLRNI